MDSLLTAAARHLAAGDPLGSLKRIALRDEPPALALRGIAMAQLGDYDRARHLLRHALRAFGANEGLAKARCQVALGEVALASRDLRGASEGLGAAVRVLAAHRDTVNAFHARVILARFHLLVGELEAAGQALEPIDLKSRTLPPALVARAELTRAELALRHVRPAEAALALKRARHAGRKAGIPGLRAEVDRLGRALQVPSARILRAGAGRPLRLAEVETLFKSGALVVDACRREVRLIGTVVRLAGRPVLFGLMRAMADAWPGEVSRDELIRQAFGARMVHESDRVRLRVELSRLRGALRPLLRIEPTVRGFRCVPLRAAEVVVLEPPVDGPAGAILALLQDGEAWSTAALSRALSTSQRTVQRTLADLEGSAAVRSVGRGRARRWLAPAPGGFATTLLLPRSLPMR